MQQAEIQKYDRLLASMERTLAERLTGEIIDETQDSMREVLSDDLDTAALSEALEVANIVGMNDQKTYEAVRSARQRIRDGVFGICQESERSGGRSHRIAPNRLSVIPYAENCIDCQKKVEAREPTQAPRLPEGWMDRN